MKDNSGERIVEKIFQFTGLENKQVLEIGCGNRRITSLLVGKPEKLVAIEPDAEKIKEAQKNVSGDDFQIAGHDDDTIFKKANRGELNPKAFSMSFFIPVGSAQHIFPQSAPFAGPCL